MQGFHFVSESLLHTLRLLRSGHFCRLSLSPSLAFEAKQRTGSYQLLYDFLELSVIDLADGGDGRMRTGCTGATCGLLDRPLVARVLRMLVPKHMER